MTVRFATQSAALIVTAWRVAAADFTAYDRMGVAISAATNGLYVAVAGRDDRVEPGRAYVARASEPLVFKFFTTTTNGCLVYYSRWREGLCRIELFDQAGHRSKKSRFGRKFGSQLPAKAFVHGRCASRSTGPWEAGPPDSLGLDGNQLEPVDDLFNIRSPGRYVLRLTFQIWKVDAKNDVVPVNLLPVELPIEKEAEPEGTPWGRIVAGLTACALGVGWLVVGRVKRRARW